MSGTTWETTPDGRSGWLQNLLAEGIETHVVDNVERGRAGWCPLPNVWQGEPILRTIEEAWTRFRFGEVDAQGIRHPFLGQRFPIDHLDAFARSFVPRWTTTGALASAALAAVIEKVGSCVLFCHSQGAEAAFTAASRYPNHVQAIVAVEPTGFCEPLKICNIPVLLVTGDYLDQSDHWRNVLARQHVFAEQLSAAGGQFKNLHLPETGIYGNTHMLMADNNNGEILNLVLNHLRHTLV